jgi:NADH-quinone oxidoreductase subunit H
MIVDTIHGFGQGLVAAGWWTGVVWPVVWTLLKIIIVVIPLMLAVAYLTLWERKAIGFTQIRIGPNRIGPLGLLQPIADALKLMTKEIILPTVANKGLFLLGPIMTIMPALAAWAVIPFGPDVALANINAGLLFVMAITSLEVYGVIIAGWASNSKYAFLGALRASAQMVSYEIAMGFCFVVVLMVTGSLNMSEIVNVQGKGMFANMGVGLLSWNWLPLLPIFVVYFISGLAETNRHPFDVVEGESEIVAGHMIELRDVLPGRVRQHVARLDPDRGAVPGRMAAAVRVPELHPRLDLAGRQDLLRGHHVPVGALDVPALPL